MSTPDPLRRLGDVEASTEDVAADVLAYLDARGTPLPDHPDTGDPVVWGLGTSSEHATGRALDFMVPGHRDVGEAIADYVWANRDRFGVIHWIYRRRIRSTRLHPGVIRARGDQGGATDNHMDHLHLFLDGTAAVDTPAATPATTSTTPKEGTIDVDNIDLRNAHHDLVRGPGVAPLQRLLNIADDGLGGPRTRDELGDAQTAAHVARDYIFGPVTAEALLAGKGGI